MCLSFTDTLITWFNILKKTLLKLKIKNKNMVCVLKTRGD